MSHFHGDHAREQIQFAGHVERLVGRSIDLRSLNRPRGFHGTTEGSSSDSYYYSCMQSSHHGHALPCRRRPRSDGGRIMNYSSQVLFIAHDSLPRLLATEAVCSDVVLLPFVESFSISCWFTIKHTEFHFIISSFGYDQHWPQYRNFLLTIFDRCSFYSSFFCPRYP